MGLLFAYGPRKRMIEHNPDARQFILLRFDWNNQIFYVSA